MQLRCATDDREVITTWTGQVEARIPDQPAKPLFRVAGMNIARCIHIRDRWYLTSREMMLYLDDTGAPLQRWTNPWTGREVPVVHVANELVQNELRGPIPVAMENAKAVVNIHVAVEYPNPIARDERVRRYSPQAQYRATEHFELSTSPDFPAAPTVPHLDLRWKRTGPWLPWMDMGDAPGELVYDAVGRRIDTLDELPAPLRAEIEQRLPLYSHAPKCLAAGRNQTSWTYFLAHVEAYERGERFPLPAPAREESCVESLQR